MSITLNQNLGGVAYRILNDGSGKESFGFSGTNAKNQMVYACAWGDRFVFRQKLIGDAYQDPSGNVVIIPAQPHPAYSNLFGSGVDFEPLGRPTGANSWQYAKATVTYSPLPSNSNNPDDLREDSVELSGEVQTTDGSDWVIADSLAGANNGDAVKASHSVNRSIPTKNVRITLYKSASLPSALVDLLYGKLNSGNVLLAGKTYSVGQVLYCGYSAQRKTTSLGNTTWTITHHFICSPFDQRREFVLGQMLLITNSNGDYKFDTASFAALGNIS